MMEVGERGWIGVKTVQEYSPKEISHQEKPACVVIDGNEDGGKVRGGQQERRE